MVGLADYAATKMVDKQKHFPGPGSYNPKVVDSPRKGVSIANRVEPKSTVQTPADVGPGRYDVKTTMGEGLKKSFSPRLDGAASSSGASTESSPRKEGSTPRKNRGPLPDLPTQYNMAENPSTPRFSLYGRHAVKQPDNMKFPGPGQYTLGSTLDKNGKTLSGRLDVADLEAAEKPGPDRYNVARFGDKIPVPKAPYIPHANPNEFEYPGPGWYEGHGTIAERVSPRRNRISTEPLFGSRVFPPNGKSVAPGPGAYDQVNGTFVEQLAHRQGKTIGNRNVPSGELDSIYPKPGPGEYTIPSTFDDKKGFSLQPRRPDPPPKLIVPGPQDYHVNNDMAHEINTTHKGMRFNGGKMFSKDSAPKSAKLDDKPGPGAYSPEHDLQTPRVKGFTFNSRSEAKSENPFVDWANAPGPGTYNPKTVHTEKHSGGTTFHKGNW